MNNDLVLGDLRVFCLVARRASFALVAEELGASAAFVSKRIRKLEASLGVKLLHRSTRRVAITEDGERVYLLAQRILSDVAQIQEEVSDASQHPRGLMRISSSFGFGRQHVAPALAQLAEHYPQLEIRFDVLDKMVDLVAEGIDLDIHIGNDIAPHLVARKLRSNHRLLCASPAYLATHGTPSSLKALGGYRCLAIKERDHPFGVWRLHGPHGEETVKVSSSLSSNNGEIVHQWALAGHGIMLRSLWDVQQDLQEGRLVQLLPEYRQEADIWAVYPSRLSASAKLRVCVQWFEQYFQQQTLG